MSLSAEKIKKNIEKIWLIKDIVISLMRNWNIFNETIKNLINRFNITFNKIFYEKKIQRHFATVSKANGSNKDQRKI